MRMHTALAALLTCFALIAFPVSAAADDDVPQALNEMSASESDAETEAELEALAAEAHGAVSDSQGERASGNAQADRGEVGGERGAGREAFGAMASAAPAPGMTRVTFDLSRRRKPYSVHLVGTDLTCEAPCILDVPNGEAEFVFSAGRRDRVQLVRKYDLDGDNLHLELVRRNNTAMRIAGITFAALGGGALGLGIFGTVLAIESRHSSNEGVIGYAVFIVIGYVGALAYGIPGILMIAKSRPKVVAREAPRRLSVKETIKESFQFGFVPVREGAVATAGFRF